MYGSILAFVEYDFLGQEAIGTINAINNYDFADAYAPELRVGAIPLADFFCDNSCPAQPFLSIPVPAGAWAD